MSIICQVCQTSHQNEVPFCRECGYPLKGEGLALEGRCIGNYRLVQRIGGGGFGEVYRAEHVELGKPFAVKILHSRLSSDEQFVERFRNEAMVLAGLQHENVVQVVDFGQHADIGFYLVMEWLEGRSLHRVWRRKRIFPLGQVYALFSQLLDALQLAHSLGVVHRDMKPENLLLIKGSRGRTILKIVDFGIATLMRGKPSEEDPLNQSGVAVGTPYYMSPEQASGKPDLVDHRSDIYACGVILAELLSGRRLYKSKDPKTILRHQKETPPPTLQELHPKGNYSKALQGILDKALAKPKEQRFASASEFYDALDAVMKAENVRLDDEGLDEAPTTTSSTTNLLSLVGASGDELDGISSSSTPNFQGQKSNSRPTPSLSLKSDDLLDAPPKKQQWALWGGIAFGFFITVALGIFVLWGSSLKSGHAKRIHSLPPLDAGKNVRTITQVPDAGSTPTTPPDVGATTAPEPPAIPDASSRPEPPDTSAQEPDTQVEPPPPRRKKRTTRKSQRRKSQRTRSNINRRRPKKRRKKTKRRVVAKISPQTSRMLSINTQPRGANVYLDGRKIGTTPLKKRFPMGQSYMIQVKKKGYVSPKPFPWNSSQNLTRSLELIEDL